MKPEINLVIEKEYKCKSIYIYTVSYIVFSVFVKCTLCLEKVMDILKITGKWYSSLADIDSFAEIIT